MKTIDISWRRYILPNIHNEGWKFVGIFAAVTALLAMMWEPLGWIGIALTIWCFYLFRNNGLNQKAILSVHFQRVAGSLSPAAAFGSNLCG